MGFEEINEYKYIFKKTSSIDITLIEGFSCGAEPLDKKLLQMKENDEGTTIVFLDESANQIIGYCTYCTSGLRLSYENDAKTNPAVEIRYFAIDEFYQHKKYTDGLNFSDIMLCQIIKHLIDISNEIIAFEYILLYSVPDAVNFYKRNGFNEFTEYMNRDSYNYISGCVPMFFEL